MSQNKSLVVKDNRLIEASYRLDLSEQRLMLLAIVQARGLQPITGDTLIEINAADYADACLLDTKSGYRRLKEAADNLFQRWVQLKGVDVLTGKQVLIKTRWVSSCAYVDNAGLVRLRIAPEIIPYITELEANFTSYALKNVVQMTSSYAIRLYELLAQYKTIGSRYISLPELRNFLDANEKSYDRLQNFKIKVLNIGVDQINQYTDLNITCEPERLGRSVIGYHFSIEKKAVKHPAEEPKNPKETKPKAKVKIGLSTAEKSMLKQLAAKTGQTEAALLEEARQKSSDLFLVLDEMTQADAKVSGRSKTQMSK